MTRSQRIGFTHREVYDLHCIGDINHSVVVHISHFLNEHRCRFADNTVHNATGISNIYLSVPVCITFYDIYWYILRVLKGIKQAYLSTKG